jgi:putative addiction module component (TIGR02574 family)
MSGVARGIFEAAMKLDPRGREELIEELSASIDVTNLDDYWETEIKRRIEDVDSGRVKPVPADEVFDRLERRFGGK